MEILENSEICPVKKKKKKIKITAKRYAKVDAKVLQSCQILSISLFCSKYFVSDISYMYYRIYFSKFAGRQTTLKLPLITKEITAKYSTRKQSLITRWWTFYSINNTSYYHIICWSGCLRGKHVRSLLELNIYNQTETFFFFSFLLLQFYKVLLYLIFLHVHFILLSLNSFLKPVNAENFTWKRISFTSFRNDIGVSHRSGWF